MLGRELLASQTVYIMRSHPASPMFLTDRLGKYVAHRHTTNEFLQRPVPAVPSVTKATAGGGGMLDGKTHKVIGLHTHFRSMISYHM